MLCGLGLVDVGPLGGKLVGGEGAVVGVGLAPSVVKWSEFAVGRDESDSLTFPRRDIPSHPRRVRRHSRNRQPHGVRAHVEQAGNGTDRHMPLNDVPVDEGRVPRLCSVGYSMP